MKNNRYYSRIDEIDDITNLSKLVCKEYSLEGGNIKILSLLKLDMKISMQL